MEVSEGQILASKYRIERVLGRGAMRVVRAGTHLQLAPRVALKFSLPEALESQNPGCVGKGPYCGDDVMDVEYEFCDEGLLNGTPGHCRVTCGGICGDGSRAETNSVITVATTARQGILAQAPCTGTQ
jgi:hypothetical protein